MCQKILSSNTNGWISNEHSAVDCNFTWLLNAPTQHSRWKNFLIKRNEIAWQPISKRSVSFILLVNGSSFFVGLYYFLIQSCYIISCLVDSRCKLCVCVVFSIIFWYLTLDIQSCHTQSVKCSHSTTHFIPFFLFLFSYILLSGIGGLFCKAAFNSWLFECLRCAWVRMELILQLCVPLIFQAELFDKSTKALVFKKES